MEALLEEEAASDNAWDQEVTKLYRTIRSEFRALVTRVSAISQGMCGALKFLNQENGKVVDAPKSIDSEASDRDFRTNRRLSKVESYQNYEFAKCRFSDVPIERAATSRNLARSAGARKASDSAVMIE